jgi:hypothetical protein
MIIDLINFLVEKHRRWKYKEDYEDEAKIKFGPRNVGLQFKTKGKETYIDFNYPILHVTSIGIWDNGDVISDTEKALMFIDLLDYIYNYAGTKATVSIDINHPDKEFWESKCIRQKHNIKEVILFDKEVELQKQIKEISVLFDQGKTVTVGDITVDNIVDLEKELRKHM